MDIVPAHAKDVFTHGHGRRMEGKVSGFWKKYRWLW